MSNEKEKKSLWERLVGAIQGALKRQLPWTPEYKQVVEQFRATPFAQKAGEKIIQIAEKYPTPARFFEGFLQPAKSLYGMVGGEVPERLFTPPPTTPKEEIIETAGQITGAIPYWRLGAKIIEAPLAAKITGTTFLPRAIRFAIGSAASTPFISPLIRREPEEPLAKRFELKRLTEETMGDVLTSALFIGGLRGIGKGIEVITPHKIIRIDNLQDLATVAQKEFGIEKGGEITMPKNEFWRALTDKGYSIAKSVVDALEKAKPDELIPSPKKDALFSVLENKISIGIDEDFIPAKLKKVPAVKVGKAELPQAPSPEVPKIKPEVPEVPKVPKVPEVPKKEEVPIPDLLAEVKEFAKKKPKEIRIGIKEVDKKSAEILNLMEESANARLTTGRLFKALREGIRKSGGELTKLNFVDSELDQSSRNLIVNFVKGTENRVYLALAEARKIAKDLLGREITPTEESAIIREDLPLVLKLIKQKATDIKIGKELEDPQIANQIKEAYKEVQEEIASLSLAQMKIVDELLKAGKIDPENSTEVLLVKPKELVENVYKYLRTYYENLEKILKDTPDKNIYARLRLKEWGVTNPSILRKMTNKEWASIFQKQLEKEGKELSEVIPAGLMELIEKEPQKAKDYLGFWVKEKAGYVYDADEAISKTVRYLTNNLQKTFMLSLISERDDLVSDEAREGFEKITSKKLGPLFGKYVRKDIKKDLEESVKLAEETADYVVNFFEATISAIKLSYVPYNPMSWVRNFGYGTTVQQTLGGNSILNPLNWRYYLKGWKEYADFVLQKKISDNFEEYLKAGGASGDIVSTEAMAVFEKLDEILANEKNIPKVYTKFISELINLGAKPAEAYQHLDAINKYIMYLHRISKGDDPIEAVLYANRYLNNYLTNPKWARELAKGRGIIGTLLNIAYPFVSFTVANTPIWIETALSHPERLLPLLSIPFISRLYFLLKNPQLIERVRKETPLWAEGNYGIVPVGYDEKRDEIIYLDLSNLFGLPYYNPLETPRNFFFNTAKMLMGPFLPTGGLASGLYETLSGRSIYTGEKIDTALGPSTGETILRSLSPLLARVKDLEKSLKGEAYGPAGAVRPAKISLLRMIGLPVYQTRGRIEVIKKYQNIVRQYQEQLSSLLRAIRNPDVSEEARQKYTEKYRNLFREMVEKINKLIGGQPQPLKRELQETTTREIPEVSGEPFVPSLLPELLAGTGSPKIAKSLKKYLKLPKVSAPKPKAIPLKLPPLRLEEEKKKGVKIKIPPPPSPLPIY